MSAPADPLRPPFADPFAGDPVLRALLPVWLGTSHADLEPTLRHFGALAVEADPLAEAADKATPTLDAKGRVQYVDAYRRLEALAYGNGLVAMKYDPDFLEHHRPHRHLVGFTLGFLFAQAELGLFCPVCMTDGVARVLERHRPDDPTALRTIARLASSDMERLWQGAMFLTERQGGSDVGANQVGAKDTKAGWTLSGEKFFCSNVDAGATLVLARMPGHGVDEGTKGLGLFLVLPDQAHVAKTLRIVRLKDKLGVRSMATGEVEFRATPAHLVGGAGDGFKMMMDMVALSRLYNAVAASAAMRRSVSEALAWGRARTAFGKRVIELPLWRATVADLVAESYGAFLLTFAAVRALDAADQGDAEAARLVRFITPVAKATTGKLSVSIASEALEAVGGNAYVDGHPLQRVLRDAQVLPVWEGTTNMQALDAVRALADPTALPAVRARVTQALATARTLAGVEARGMRDAADAGLDRIELQARALLKAESGARERAARAFVDDAARTLTLAFLLEAAAVAPDARAVLFAAARRVAERPAATVPMAGPYAHRLADTEAPLLDAPPLATRVRERSVSGIAE